MKAMKPMLIGAAALAALGAVGVLASAPATAEKPGAANTRPAPGLATRTFTVANMTCAACPITVRRAMAGVDGVKSVQIDFGAKTATVTFDPARTTIRAIADASRNAGYPARPAPGGH